MAEEQKRSISELVDDDKLMTEAIWQGIREELLSHARAGNSVPEQVNGEVVWITPEEIYRRLGCAPPPGQPAS